MRGQCHPMLKLPPVRVCRIRDRRGRGWAAPGRAGEAEDRAAASSGQAPGTRKARGAAVPGAGAEDPAGFLRLRVRLWLPVRSDIRNLRLGGHARWRGTRLVGKQSKNGTVLLQRDPGSDHAAAFERGFSHHDAEGKAADNPVADGEVRPLRQGAGRKLAEYKPPVAEFRWYRSAHWRG